MKTIDLNCDVGEGVGLESDLLPLVSSANVACGAHAGDESTMAETMRLAAQHNVCVGAHPGFADRENFGRREMPLPLAAIQALVTGQLEALARHGKFHYVKPHGALYNMAARDKTLATAVATAVKAFDDQLWLMGLAGSELVRAGETLGLNVVREAFADRAYDDEGRLVSRKLPGAMIATEEAAVEQVWEMVNASRVRTVAGAWVAVEADSICLHGDNPQAVAFAVRLREALMRENVTIESPIVGP